MLSTLDYTVKKSEDCILINVNNWIYPSNISVQKMSGRASVSCITEALKSHYCSDVFKDYTDELIKEGDYILLTSVAADISIMRSYEMEDGQKYFNLPIQQVLGTFKNNKLDFESLQMCYNKILIERIELSSSDYITLKDTSTMLGKVIKIGTTGLDSKDNPIPLKVKEGDVVLIKDNVTTKVRLSGQVYYAVEDRHVVGIVNGEFSPENIRFVNESILMKQYHGSHVLNSNILILPEIEYEDLDYSDIHNRDLFKVEYVDEDLKDISKGDILLVKRDFTNYVYFNQEKYFLLNGKDWVETKIIEE